MDWSRKDKLVTKSVVFIILILFSLQTVASQGYGGLDYKESRERETFETVSSEWNYSQKINFAERWEGKRNWGGPHRLYTVKLNTKELISEGKMREDCKDIRIASNGKLAGTRVQSPTCNTTETWIYFSNFATAFGTQFDSEKKINQIQIFYGNKDEGISNYRVSEYNRNLATTIRPESAIEMYFGSHDNTWVDHSSDGDPHLHYNDQDAPEQKWHIDFQHDHGDQPTEHIHIEDEDGNSVARDTDDDYVIDTSNVPSWVERGERITVYFESEYNSYGSDGTTYSASKSAVWGRQNRAPNQPNNPDPAQSTSTSPVYTTSPNLNVDVSDPDGDQMDVSFYSGTSSTSFLGEAGLITNMHDDNWYGASFNEGFSTTPYVFATTQTEEGGQDPGSAQVRGVDANGFSSQHCEYDGGDACDTHNPEDNGWIALNPDGVSSYNGMDAGLVNTNGGTEDRMSVTFDEDFSSTPIVMAQIQTEQGSGDPLNAKVISKDTNGATIEYCEQDSTDGCGTHSSIETVAWWAVDPSTADKNGIFDWGTVDVSDSNWQSVSFGTNFDSAPAVLVTPQTQNGGQEDLYGEALNVDTSGADVRYCESDADDYCDTHATEEVGWIAVERGRLEASGGGSGTLINTDTNVNDGGTASIEWSGLNGGQTYDWYAKACDPDGLCTFSDTFTFEVSEGPLAPDDPNPSDGADIYASSGEVDLSARYRHSDGQDPGTLTFYNEDGSQIGSCEANHNNRCSVTKSVTNGQRYDWYVVAQYRDQTATSNQWYFRTNTPPEKPTNPNPSDGAEHINYNSKTLSAYVEDVDGDSMDITFSGSSASDSFSETTSVSGSGTASVTVNNMASGEIYDWTVTAEDEHGASTTSNTWTFTTNYLPTIQNPDPEDGEYISADEVELSISVSDDDGDQTDIRIYDRNGNKLGSGETGDGSQKTISADYTGLNFGETYDWTVEANDTYGTNSKTFSFSVIGGESFRPVTGIDYQYSSLIKSSSQARFLKYEVTNMNTNEKELQTTLSGLDAQFQEHSGDTHTYTLQPGETKTFRIEVFEQNKGEYMLDIITEDQRLGVQNKDSIPVVVREFPASAVDRAPGLMWIQLLFLAAGATVLYSALL